MPLMSVVFNPIQTERVICVRESIQSAENVDLSAGCPVVTLAQTHAQKFASSISIHTTNMDPEKYRPVWNKQTRGILRLAEISKH